MTEEKNCSEPAYQEFPDDGFTNEQRSGGAIIIHVLIVSLLIYGINNSVIPDGFTIQWLHEK